MKKNKLIQRNALPKDYSKILNDIIKHISESQIKAISAVTKELTSLYWYIGKTISTQQQENGWGSNVVETLAKDLQKLYPEISGFSQRNIFRMQAFFSAYKQIDNSDANLTDLPIFSIPWGHNAVLLEKIKDAKTRLWYAKKTIENDWSRASLTMWIESELHKRQGKAITNFKKTLPMPHSDLAEQSLKDPYNFDFLMMDERARERELEMGLIEQIQKFLLELGQGFAFIARQYPIKIGSKDFFIDMLFYHVKLRCFIVVELKIDELCPSNVGQINTYLVAVDKHLKHPDDNPSIGLLLCKSKDNIVAEYALQTINQPIGISSYTTKLVASLPKNLKGKLPTIKELESELEKTTETVNKKSKTVKTATKKTNKKTIKTDAVKNKPTKNIKYKKVIKTKKSTLNKEIIRLIKTIKRTRPKKH